MAEPLQGDLEAFLAAREQARAAFNAAVAPAIASKLVALARYQEACRVADADPADPVKWSAATAARVAYLAVVDATTKAVAAAMVARDVAIKAAGLGLDKAIVKL